MPHLQSDRYKKEKLGFKFGYSPLKRVGQTFSVKVQTVNILGVAGHIQPLALPLKKQNKNKTHNLLQKNMYF